MHKKIKSIIQYLAIVLTSLGLLLFLLGIYLKYIVNSPKFLEIADISIKKASFYIRASRMSFNVGIVGLILGLALIAYIAITKKKQ